jgi:hypothetical protein
MTTKQSGFSTAGVGQTNQSNSDNRRNQAFTFHGTELLKTPTSKTKTRQLQFDRWVDPSHSVLGTTQQRTK